MSSEAFYVWDMADEQVSPKSKYDDLLAAFRCALARDDVLPTERVLAFCRLLPQLVRDNPDVDTDVIDYFGKVEAWALKNRYGALRLELPVDPFWVAKRVLVNAAVELGVVLFDDLQGMFFLPDGRILPEALGKKWHGALRYLDQPRDFPTTVPQFRKLAAPLLEAILVRRGYMVNKVVPKGWDEDTILYSRQVDCGEQVVGFGFWRDYEGLMISLSLVMSCPTANDMRNQFKFTESNDIYSFSLRYDFKDKMKDVMHVSDLQSLDKLLGAIEEHVLSVHDATKNMEGLNHLIEGRLGEKLARSMVISWRAPTTLVVLRLAGNKDFDKFAKEIPDQVVTWGRIPTAQGLAEWPKLVDYLKTHFDDDGNPIEASRAL